MVQSLPTKKKLYFAEAPNRGVIPTKRSALKITLLYLDLVSGHEEVLASEVVFCASST